MGLDTKTYWLIDRQLQFDFDFDFDLLLPIFSRTTEECKTELLLRIRSYIF
jgi:hypothetical protein